jgi:hypothetical protein
MRDRCASDKDARREYSRAATGVNDVLPKSVSRDVCDAFRKFNRQMGEDVKLCLFTD